MRLELASVNFKNCDIGEREKVAFSDDKVRQVINRIIRKDEILGCVVLATCNRTELYVSLRDSADFSLGDLLLEAAEIEDFSGSFEIIRGKDVAYYLTELASGLKSQILGEGQIVSQIKHAICLSREEKTADSVLNVLFNKAIAAGKKVLTKATISNVPLSSAYGAFELLRQEYADDLKNKKALIIGNGNMGRLMQQLLHEQGCQVVVTIRGYAHGNNIVVEGCKKIAYADRYNYMSQCDFVISATRSPHHTVEADKLMGIDRIPELMIDLAMPRDIASDVTKLCTVKNINELGYETKVDEETLTKVYAIIDEYVADFYHWYSYEESLEEIALLKKSMIRRIEANYKLLGIDFDEKDKAIEIAVDRSLKMLLGGMHEFVDVDKLKECRIKIEKRTK